MTRISRREVTVEVASGWEAELTEYPGGRVVLHMSNGPLPAGRSDFGGHAIATMPTGRVFLAFLEYEQSDSGRGLFSRVGPPSFFVGEFSPAKLHRYVQGQSGAQRFFSVSGRTFCCYAVIGRHPVTQEDVARVNQALRTIEVSSLGR